MFNSSFGDLYGQLLESADLKYNAKKVTSLVTIFKNTEKERTKDKMKLMIYMALSKAVLKGINNFNFLCKGVPEYKKLLTNDDVAHECYIVLDRCISNVQMEYVGNFYYYFNKGLNRAVHRLYEDTYKKEHSYTDMEFSYNDEAPEEKFNDHKKEMGYNQHFDFTEFDLRRLNDEEKLVVAFKVAGGKLNQFLKENGMALETFESILESAKEKIKGIYEEDYLLAGAIAD